MANPTLLHLTTTDISLELLLGPQLEAFVDAGYEVHAAAAPGPFVEAVVARGVHFHPLKHSTRSMSIGSDLRAAREAYRLFRRLRPDVVHTHNPKPGIYGRIGARLARVPAVVNTVHGLYAQPTDPLARRLAVYGLERLAAGFSHAELVQNREDVATLRKLRVPAGRVHHLGNGIDLGRFRPDVDHRHAIRHEIGAAEDTVVVGTVGRLVAEKGYPELFDAWQQVIRAHPTAKLVVVGPHEPEKADALPPALVERAADAGIVLLGHRDDVERIYPAMDLFVLASHREGYPRSAMEAAASGVALIATDIRGCREVVDHGSNGVLVPVRNTSALAANLIDLIDDESRRSAMGRAGLAKAAADFDQQAVIDTTLATYRRLLG